MFPEEYGDAAKIKDLERIIKSQNEKIVSQDLQIKYQEKRLQLDDADIHDFFSQLQKTVHDNAKDKGWWKCYDNGTVHRKNPLEIYALIHSEISEAVEEARNGHPPTYTVESTSGEGKPEGEAIELADAIIRILDYAESMGWNMGQALDIKMRYNKTRPHRHGGKKY